MLAVFTHKIYNIKIMRKEVDVRDTYECGTNVMIDTNEKSVAIKLSDIRKSEKIMRQRCASHTVIGVAVLKPTKWLEHLSNITFEHCEVSFN